MKRAETYWTYKQDDMPTLREAIALGAISPETTEAGWSQLSPGMRREIVRVPRMKFQQQANGG